MKDIHAYSDLAINGAVPAFDEPLHVGKPNVGERALLNIMLMSYLKEVV
ncbi:hypothetical protein [Candidatus Reidiella endopervernicosa]|nr:hypothetical protein [Candidatus Reidiella endopervernicosa]